MGLGLRELLSLGLGLGLRLLARLPLRLELRLALRLELRLELRELPLFLSRSDTVIGLRLRNEVERVPCDRPPKFAWPGIVLPLNGEPNEGNECARALAGDDDARGGFGGRSSRPDEKESEMRAWLALLVGASAVGSVLAAYGCEDSNRDGTRSLANTARVLTTAIVCFANGEDETESNES